MVQAALPMATLRRPVPRFGAKPFFASVSSMLE
jgi:hypothetical protein